MGTLNVLEAARKTPSVKAIVNVTSDKCYENHEWHWPYRETDQLGGRDPYSASKACAEIITSAYRKSFFDRQGVFVATARAGNVIGGGDWASGRLIPDILRACQSREKLQIRAPSSTRPWQHVFDSLAGYLSLAELLYSDGSRFDGAWNFGPNKLRNLTVKEVVKVGNTSITIRLEARRHSVYNGSQRKVLSTDMTFVRIDGDGEAIPISEKVRLKFSKLNGSDYIQ